MKKWLAMRQFLLLCECSGDHARQKTGGRMQPLRNEVEPSDFQLLDEGARERCPRTVLMKVCRSSALANARSGTRRA
jgi:hypothetical protein